ncbi:hypothetical protein UCDDA912_g04725 [Diaporthe ampelina]|uniref:Uncharacterized protein n=1 Tax=Diaporthe ampelina TaxID=1214573 RepID=A0A0G2I602_9PEZI|nr:hypothetical protein UCDDA912_g04725 [Diaporthe ampelina]
MPRRKNAGKALAAPKATRGRKGSRSRSPPKTPPRPRVLCPGCSTELTLHKMLSDTPEFIYASNTDMKKLSIECENESCAFYIEGVEGADETLPVNPLVEKCIRDAKEERAAKKDKKKEGKAESKEKKREEKKAEYAKYDPFSGTKEKEAKEGLERQKLQEVETEKIIKSWKKIKEAAEKLEKFENEAAATDE